MPHCKIVICDKSRPDTDPAFPEINDKTFESEATLHGAAILQGGMASGKTSIGLAIQLPNGKYIMVQTSRDIFEGIFAAIRGAEQRWHDERADKN